METDTHLDLETLVGSMEQLPCEHFMHETQTNFHAGPAAYYASSTCPCGYTSAVQPVCAKFLSTAILGPIKCRACHEVTGLTTVLGPVRP